MGIIQTPDMTQNAATGVAQGNSTSNTALTATGDYFYSVVSLTLEESGLLGSQIAFDAQMSITVDGPGAQFTCFPSDGTTSALGTVMATMPGMEFDITTNPTSTPSGVNRYTGSLTLTLSSPNTPGQTRFFGVGIAIVTLPSGTTITVNSFSATATEIKK